MNKKLLAVASLAILSLAVPAARADTQGITFTSVNPSDVFNNGGGYSLGYVFTATATATVDALGYFDDGNHSSLTENHSVGLYNSSGVLLASTVVSNSTGSQVGFFDFNSISGVTLIAGNTYQVVGTTGFVDPYAFNTIGFASASNITVDNAIYTNGNTLAFGTIVDPLSNGIFGANFEETSSVAATPEPSSLALLGTGLAGALGMIRRRMLA